MFDTSKVVAKGRIKSMDPSSMVGGQALTENWCEVVVSIPLHREEKLIRPYGLVQSIIDSVGISIAWPCHLVISHNLLYSFTFFMIWII